MSDAHNHTLTVPSAVFAATALFAGTDILRPNLDNVVLDYDDPNVVHAVATNGATLVRITFKAPDHGFKGRIAFPPSLAKALAKGKCDVTVWRQGRDATITKDGMTCAAAFDSGFPDWRTIVGEPRDVPVSEALFDPTVAATAFKALAALNKAKLIHAAARVKVYESYAMRLEASAIDAPMGDVLVLAMPRRR